MKLTLLFPRYSHSSKSLSNRYVHLTNYSVNKNNDDYIKNEDESGTDSHKWYVIKLLFCCF